MIHDCTVRLMSKCFTARMSWIKNPYQGYRLWKGFYLPFRLNSNKQYTFINKSHWQSRLKSLSKSFLWLDTKRIHAMHREQLTRYARSTPSRAASFRYHGNARGLLYSVGHHMHIQYYKRRTGWKVNPEWWLKCVIHGNELHASMSLTINQTSPVQNC